MSIDSVLRQWMKSGEGKAKVQAARNSAMKAGKSFGVQAAGGQSVKPPQFYVDEMQRLVTQYASVHNHDYGEYLGTVALAWNDGLGKWVIELQFDPVRSRRESWYPEGASDWGSYADGVDIVQLMNRGYEARHHVYLKEGNKTLHPSRIRYEGEFFIQSAIREFNALYGTEAVADYDHEKFDRIT